LGDGLYQLYKTVSKISKTGKETISTVLVDETFRVIRFNVEEEPFVIYKKATFLLCN
jgi:hypothetical protein